MQQCSRPEPEGALSPRSATWSSLSCSYCTLYKVESYDSGDMYTTKTPTGAYPSYWRTPATVSGQLLHPRQRPRRRLLHRGRRHGPEHKHNVFRNNRVERTECSGLSLSTRGKEDICKRRAHREQHPGGLRMDGVHPRSTLATRLPRGARFTNNVIVRDNLSAMRPARAMPAREATEASSARPMTGW